MKLILSLLAVAFLTWPSAQAEAPAQAVEASAYDIKKEQPEIGLMPGDMAPDFEGVLSGGEAVSSTDLMGYRGMLLVFVRSAKWCPYCRKQLLELDSVTGEALERGWPITTISYDAIGDLAIFKKKRQVSYDLLSDVDSKVIKAFGLLNEKHKEGSKAYGIPHPAIYAVGADGVIAGKLMEEGYKNRPPAEAIVQMLDALDIREEASN